MERTPARLYHFSEDDSIRGFELRPAPSDPGGPLGVRAVDAVHAPLYWFPRRCPRLYVWAECPEQQDLLTDRFGTDAARIVAIESAWLDPVRTSRIHCYEFAASVFRPDDAPGHFVATEPVQPVRHGPLGDLLALHARSDVEFRMTPRLGALADVVVEAGLPYRFVNLRVATR